MSMSKFLNLFSIILLLTLSCSKTLKMHSDNLVETKNKLVVEKSNTKLIQTKYGRDRADRGGAKIDMPNKTDLIQTKYGRDRADRGGAKIDMPTETDLIQANYGRDRADRGGAKIDIADEENLLEIPNQDSLVEDQETEQEDNEELEV